MKKFLFFHLFYCLLSSSLVFANENQKTSLCKRYDSVTKSLLASAESVGEKEGKFPKYLELSFDELMKSNLDKIVISYEEFYKRLNQALNEEDVTKVIVFQLNNFDLMSKIVSSYINSNPNILKIIERNFVLLVDNSGFSEDLLKISLDWLTPSPSVFILEKTGDSESPWRLLRRIFFMDCISSLELEEFMKDKRGRKIKGDGGIKK